MLIQEKLDKFSTNCPPNAGDIFQQALSGLNTLHEQRHLLSCVDRLGSGALKSASGIQSLACQVAAQPAELASVHDDMTGLEELVAAAQCQMADGQSGLLNKEAECDEYRRRLGVEKQWSGGFEALIHSICRRLVDNSSCVETVPGFLCQDMDRDLNVYLPATFCFGARSKGWLLFFDV